MAIAAWAVATCFGLLSLYGWWFLFAVGPAHGPGAELGVIAAVLAAVAGLIARRLRGADVRRSAHPATTIFGAIGDDPSRLPRMRSTLENRAHPRNADGDFFVESECCTLCGVPWHIAPELFSYDDSACWVSRQPATVEERRLMLNVIQAQELGCVRYRGADTGILRSIEHRL